jgi:flavin reductase (DIM6/NTAB) family NADH-FMN oxidoreductase RutF
MKISTDKLTHGIYLVTASFEGKPYGMAAASATQVKSDQVLVCIGKQSVTRHAVLETRCFGFNILRHDQLELARLFGMHSCRDIDKFAGLGIHAAQTGYHFSMIAQSHWIVPWKACMNMVRTA